MKKYSSLILPIIITIFGFWIFSQPSKTNFSRTRIDIGVVVSDIETSVLFYKNTLGFSELDAFNIGAEFATKAGLTNGQPLVVRVLGAGNDKTASHLKLIQVPHVKSIKTANKFIHTQLGLSYITIFVTDMNNVLKRLATDKIKILSKGSVPIENAPNKEYLTLVADPDGNLIELIGPKL